ncbi:uncharacterized protein [Mytilus edulis]|uniref:uncharacterized protein n=1 Tax=Mytilus edulis TaxID=6550 RepID=UPI0039F0C290
MRLYTTIQNKSKIHCGFRMRLCDSIAVPQASQLNWRLAANSGREKPRYIIVAFQTDRDSDKTHNTSVFNHCRLQNIHVTLKVERYSAVDFNAGFTKNRVARVFNEAADFRKKFYNIDTLLSNGEVNPSDFIDLYPLFIIDVRHQSEWLTESTVDIHIRAKFERNVPANTEAFALVISDRVL